MTDWSMWEDVSAMTTPALIAQRTNLAKHRRLSTVYQRLIAVQAELDRRAEQQPSEGG